MPEQRRSYEENKPAEKVRQVTHPLRVEEVTKENWGDLEKLFEGKGGPKSCWCMVWRATPEEAKRTDGRSRKSFLKRRVDAGVTVGLLAYAAGEPVAWCSVAPKDTYRRLEKLQPAYKVENVWSIVCFYVRRDHRKRNVTGSLIEAAIRFAKQRGADAIEAYPVNKDSPSYRFMGFVPVFRKLGFEEIGTAGTRRHVMRLRLQ
jgi:GNAT superfamily N-acetyltransferase